MHLVYVLLCMYFVCVLFLLIYWVTDVMLPYGRPAWWAYFASLAACHCVFAIVLYTVCYVCLANKLSLSLSCTQRVKPPDTLLQRFVQCMWNSFVECCCLMMRWKWSRGGDDESKAGGRTSDERTSVQPRTSCVHRQTVRQEQGRQVVSQGDGPLQELRQTNVSIILQFSSV